MEQNHRLEKAFLGIVSPDSVLLPAEAWGDVSQVQFVHTNTALRRGLIRQSKHLCGWTTGVKGL